MCGIFCSILQNENVNKNLDVGPIITNELEELLKNRGPDAVTIMPCGPNLVLGGFVLWQQGREICNQPVDSGNTILLFNGDAYNVDHLKPKEMSDTSWLASVLDKCKTDDEICSIFRTLEGPFSLIFFNKDTQDLYFARDSLGRNSLVIEKDSSQLRVLSSSYFSNTQEKQIMELPPLGLYKVNISQSNIFKIFPWSAPNDEWSLQANTIENTFGIKISIGETIGPNWLNIDSDLRESMNLYELCPFSYTTIECLCEQLLTSKELLKELDTFSVLIENSVKNRVLMTPKHCRNCILHQQECNHSKIAILFSGGIDCSILAVLAHKFVAPDDSIDLINVAFEKINSTADNWDVPDRCSARESFVELERICPSRKWCFIEVNVKREELHTTLEDHIKHLIYPLNTVLDESIGAAFWFASRGKGICNDHKICQSSARVVIVGSGADELFGGYTRHRNSYRRCGGDEIEKLACLHAELERDWQRIPSRNLARDDRVIADNGKTARAPFIEENLVQYVRSLKPSQRCCFRLEEGVGDKLFLRLYGYRIGLRSAVSLKKRAIQFGSRIANKKQNAAHQSNYLKFVENSSAS